MTSVRIFFKKNEIMINKLLFSLLSFSLLTASFFSSFYFLLPTNLNQNFNLASEIIKQSENNDKKPLGLLTTSNTSTYYYRYNDIQFGSVKKLQDKYEDFVFLKTYLNINNYTITIDNPFTSAKENITLISTQTPKDDVANSNQALYPDISLLAGQNNVGYYPKINEIYVSKIYADDYFKSIGEEGSEEYSSLIGQTINIYLRNSNTVPFVINGVFDPSQQERLTDITSVFGNYFIIRAESTILSKPSMVFTTTDTFYKMINVLNEIDKAIPSSSLDEQEFRYSFYQYNDSNYSLESPLSEFCNDMYAHSDDIISLYFMLLSLFSTVALISCLFLLYAKRNRFFASGINNERKYLLYLSLFSFVFSFAIGAIASRTYILGSYAAKIITPFNVVPAILLLISLLAVFLFLTRENKKIKYR